jgi:alkylresorcinol/alkylpyrone synthase
MDAIQRTYFTLDLKGDRMPRIIAAGHAFPPYAVPQETARDAVRRLFARRIPELDRLLSVFDHSRIEERRFMMPLEWYLTPRTPMERNRVYLEGGLELLLEAVRECLKKAGRPPGEVDHLIWVSSTGHATPTLDARLINRLGFRPDTTRLPVWGLGCAAGAAGLARAYDYCRAHPRATVLVTALETCSLTFMAGDLSKKNLVATAIFADGAAAALVAGAEAAGAGPRMLGTLSHLFPDSYRIMGWDFLDEGMQLVLSPKLPAVIKKELPGLVAAFLKRHGLTRADVVHFVTHPGGAKVIDSYRVALGLDPEDLELTEAVLRLHGNVSSVSVLVVLEKWLAGRPESRPGHGLLSAFGPGFSAEFVLLKV